MNLNDILHDGATQAIFQLWPEIAQDEDLTPGGVILVYMPGYHISDEQQCVSYTLFGHDSKSTIESALEDNVEMVAMVREAKRRGFRPCTTTNRVTLILYWKDTGDILGFDWKHEACFNQVAKACQTTDSPTSAAVLAEAGIAKFEEAFLATRTTFGLYETVASDARPIVRIVRCLPGYQAAAQICDTLLFPHFKAPTVSKFVSSFPLGKHALVWLLLTIDAKMEEEAKEDVPTDAKMEEDTSKQTIVGTALVVLDPVPKTDPVQTAATIHHIVLSNDLQSKTSDVCIQLLRKTWRDLVHDYAIHDTKLTPLATQYPSKYRTGLESSLAFVVGGK